MLAKTFSATVAGIAAIPVTIEVNVDTASKDQFGLRMTIVGLPDNSVKESFSRIDSSLKNSGMKLAPQNIVVNLAPGDIRKEGTGFDLPIALGILLANGLAFDTQLAARFMVLGELSLDGSLQPIRGALPIAIKAREMGYEGLIVPRQNVCEAAVVNKLKVYGADNLQQVMEFFNQMPGVLEPTVIDTRAEFFAHQNQYELDFADVRT